MDNTLKNMGQRVFSAVVAAATILSMMGIAAFAVPQQAQAAGAGDLVTASLSAVYFVGYDGSRYTFPNSATYNTWYSDFSDVMTISDSAMADIALGGNVVMRAGSTWIKIQSSSKTYAVSTDGMIHWVESEEVAEGLAGSDWNTMIMDVPDTFFVDYTAGTSLAASTLWEGALYMDGSHEMIIWGGEARMLTGDAADDNHFMSDWFLDGSDIDASAYSAGDDIDAEVCDLVDASQTGCTSVSAGGDVEVSLSSSTPAGATLPKDANSVQVFEFDIEAGSEAANVNIMTFEMEGIGATTDIDNVFVYEGATRLTESRSVNASTRSVTFGSLNLDFAAGEERTFTLRVELASGASAGNEFNFAILSVDDVTADGDVDGNFPITGNTFEIANQSAGTITITKNGAMVDGPLGAQDHTIGQFKITATTEDALVTELTLKVDNAADHDDFRLWDGSVELAEGEYIGDKLVMFDLSSDPFSIQEGNSNIFKISADIGGEAADDLTTSLENAADAFAVGGDFGFGMGVTFTGYDGDSCTTSAGDCSFQDVKGGEATLNHTGPTTGDIRSNSQDQLIFEFTLTAAQDITVKDLDVIVYADDDGDNDALDADDDSGDDDDGLINTGGEGNVSDIKLVNADTGSVIMGPLELDCVTTTCGADGSSDESQTIDFTDDFGMTAGETLNLQILMDIDDTITSATEVGATVDISGLVIEDANGDNLTLATDVVPTSDLIGNNMQVLSASLTDSLASIPGDTTTVQGADNVHVQSFSMVAGAAGDLFVSQFVLSIYSDGDDGTFQLGDCTTCGTPSTVDVNEFVESCSIYDVDGNLLDGPNSPSADGNTITFDDVNWTIAASESERLDVFCDIGNPSETNDVAIAFDIADVSEDFVVEDGDGTDVDGGTDTPNGSTSPTNVVTIDAAGTLAVAAAGSTPSADFVLTGTADNHVATFDYTATNEAFVIKKLTLTEESAEEVTGTLNSAAYANNIDMVTVEYPAEDGSIYTKTATFGSGNEASVSFLGTVEEPYMYVGTDDPAALEVYVDLPLTDRVTGGNAKSNERIEIGLAADVAADFTAVGAGSGSSLDGSGSYGDSAAKTFIVRETSPAITLSSSSPSGTGFVPSDQEVLRFNIAANANEDVVWNEMVFGISATDNTGTPTQWEHCDDGDTTNGFIAESQFDIYNLSEDGLSTSLDTADTDWVLYSTEGGTIDVCDETADTNAGEPVTHAKLTLPTAEVVPAGTTHTYVLYLDTQYASAANDDSIQIKILADPVIAIASFEALGATAEIATAGLRTATTVVLEADVSASVSAGDVICNSNAANGNGTIAACASGDEMMLVTNVATTTLTMVRGYLNTTTTTLAQYDDIYWAPGSFLWQDDGTTAVSATLHTEEYYGSYLVDDLPVNGGAMGF
jgi:hypothetical protein